MSFFAQNFGKNRATAEVVCNDYASTMGFAMEALTEAGVILAETEQQQSKNDSMERLITIVDSIEAASPVELMLLENSMENLLEGSNIPAEEVFEEAFESMEGKQVSTERLKRMVSSIWEWIKTQLKKAAKAVGDFYHSIFGATTRLRKSAESIIKRAGDVGGKTLKESKIEVGAEINGLVGADVKPLNANEVAGAMSQGIEFLQDLNLNYFVDLAKLGDKLTDAMKSWDTDKNEDSLKALNAAVAESKFRQYEWKMCAKWKALPAADKRYANKTVKAESLIGGKLIAYITPDAQASAAGPTTTQTAEFIRGTSYAVISVKDKMPDAIKDAKIDIWSSDQAVEFANKVLELCDAVDEYQRKGLSEKVDKSADKLQAASDKLGKTEKDFKADEDSGINTSEARTQMRAGLYINTAFQNWSQNPHTGVIAALMQASRSGLSVASKSLSQYK